MRAPVNIFVCLLVVSIGFVGAAWALAYRLASEKSRSQQVRWLRGWSIKGALLPATLWVVMNIGFSWSLQPFMQQIQFAQMRGAGWIPVFLKYVGVGFFVVSSYWSAVTLAWALARAGSGIAGETRTQFRSLCIACGLGMLVVAGIIFALGGWPTLGFAAMAMLAPAAGYAPGILYPRKPPPMYAKAIAKTKFGKYNEAEWEIIRQLENYEDDFDGWMMLADLYANQYHHLREAEETVLEICQQPKVTPSQMSVALHRLADWHVRIGEDPDAARRALQVICDRLPGTHLAHMAKLRINQLPASAEELREKRDAAPIPLLALGDRLEETDAGPTLERKAAIDLANACAKKLKQDPNLVATREKFARLLADHLDNADQGIAQIKLLLEMPGQPDSKRAEWLSLIAAWHLKHRQDVAAGRIVLEQIVNDLPQSVQAFAARRRLELLDREARQKGPPSPPRLSS